MISAVINKMAAKAKEYRDELEVKLMGAYWDLVAETEVTPVKKRVLSKQMDNLDKVWDKLQKCHADFCRLNKVTDTESMEYIRVKGKLRREGIAAARAALGVDEDAEMRNSIAKLEGEMFQLQVDIKGNMSVLTSLTGTVLRSEQFGQTMDMLGEGERKLRRYMECSEEVAEGKEETESEAIEKNAKGYYETTSSKLLELRGNIVKQTPIKEEPSSQNTAPDHSTTRDSASGQRKNPVKIKAMECPKWDGRFRTFVRFKKLWEENIAPRHEDSALHYMLCQSLPRKVLDNISTLSTSAEEIWTYLDMKYGKPEIVRSWLS